ncbi:MAG: efflux RND transporter permease subunit [Calditrichaeota bacterium]|nr:MAG: efflux RND transporter permease subunit [Calditrichota bacterium]
MNKLIAWFARNSVAANLLMFIVIAGGLLTIGSLKYEVFPEATLDMVRVTVLYPGAAPEEVEEGVCQRIEEAIQDIEGIKELTAVARENTGSVTAEIQTGYDPKDIMDEIKSRVDAITSFPKEIEKPVIAELVRRTQVINVAVSGHTDMHTLKRLADGIRDDLLRYDDITQVVVSAVPPYEIALEVSEKDLRRYNLTFDEVANAIRRFSLDLPGGVVRAESGEILLRTKGQAYTAADFERIPLRVSPDGAKLYVGDVARVKDGFAETDAQARFDGQPAAVLQVFRVGNESALRIAEDVKEYLALKKNMLPEGIRLTTWQDDTRILRSRMNLLFRNGRAGLILVFLVLALFLKLRLAGWVSFGIVFSFIGSLWLLPGLDVSINLLSLFAFIVVLGIVVDDAIVIGENVYTYLEKGMSPLQAAIKGTQQVAVPVIFAVLTTFAAFVPLLLVEGVFGKFMRVIPLVVIATLSFSLIESLFVLPTHLGHMRMEKDHKEGWWGRIQNRFDRWLKHVVDVYYRRTLEWALRYRYISIAIGLAVFIVSVSIVGAGWIKFYFFPDVEADNVVAELLMPLGTPVTKTSEVVRRLEESAEKLQKELQEKGEGNVIVHVMTSIGSQPFRERQSRSMNGNNNFSGAHLAEVNIELMPSEEREITSAQIVNRWRELTGPVPDAEELSFSSSIVNLGEPVNVELAGPDYKELNDAAAALKHKLSEYEGVFDITDSYQAGKREIKLHLSDEGRAMGLSLSDLGRQVRQAFYGEEVQRIQRGRDEIKVMLRFPRTERESLRFLENMRIRLPNGIEVPFTRAATVEMGRGYASISRRNRNRTIQVKADVNDDVTTPNQVLADLKQNVMPELVKKYPGIRYSFEGEQKNQRETMAGLQKGFLMALLIIYVLLAIPFKSYIQPLIVMSAIPFGLIGAILGHVILGYDLTILSMFGIVALTGVVVNDSLVMVDFINQERAEGIPVAQAIRDAGMKRFRPILLTSLTTFLGLMPLLLEKSMQARFLIPMAISLGFGVLFATFITLILVPVIYLTQEDVKRRLGLRGERAVFE